MGKERTLKNLKVRVNKDGTLSKPSLEAIEKLNAAQRPGIGEKIASRVSAHDVVEAAGFAGLVAVNYYGIDILGMFLGQATKVVEAVVESVEDFNTIVTEKYGEFGWVITATALATVPGLVIGVGMPRVVVEETVAEEAGMTAKQKAQLEFVLETMEKWGAPEEKTGPVREELEKLKIITPEKEKDIMMNLWHKLFLRKLAIATGMAYAEKKFLESYNYYKAIENVPFVE